MAALGDIVTTPASPGAWVVAGPYFGSVPGWRLVRRSASVADALEAFSEADARLTVLASPTFAPGQSVKVALLGTGIVVADRGETVRVRLSRRHPTKGGECVIGWTNETDVDRAGLVAENLSMFL